MKKTFLQLEAERQKLHDIIQENISNQQEAIDKKVLKQAEVVDNLVMKLMKIEHENKV